MACSDHFRQRVLERCPPGTDPDLLAENIAAAIRQDRRDLIERVIPARSRDGSIKRTIWRVRIAGESIYVVVSDSTGWPVTVLTQEQMAVTKAARKARRKREDFEVICSVKEAYRHGRQRIVRLRKSGGAKR